MIFIVRYRSIAIVLLLTAAIFAQNAQPAQPPSEKQKIETLIATVENLKDAVFIRNGKEYDCTAAGKHLRMKWSRAGGRIKTARQFIEHLASRSSASGKPYMIRFADGKLINSGDFFAAELERIESATTQPAESS